METEMRPMIRFIKNMKLKDLVGGEVGVKTGTNARSILQNLDMKMLYLIDPYDKISNYYSGDRPQRFREILETTLLKEYPDKTTFIQKTSVEAYPDLPDNLDFVYLDGNHSYPIVKEDIKNYYSKIRIGGVFGGHDYEIHHGSGVRNAVDKFAKNYGYKVNSEYSEFPTINKGGEDWWVVKI